MTRARELYVGWSGIHRSPCPCAKNQSGASCLQHFPQVLQAPHQAPARQTGQTKEQEACSGWLVEAATALLPRQLQRFWPCLLPTSPTSPHSCGGSEFWREGWGSTNQLPWNTNGSVQLYPSGLAVTKCSMSHPVPVFWEVSRGSGGKTGSGAWGKWRKKRSGSICGMSFKTINYRSEQKYLPES